MNEVQKARLEELRAKVETDLTEEEKTELEALTALAPVDNGGVTQ